jgi:hypothetical protein
MTAHRDPDRLIHAFLMEGETELADQAYDAVRARIETTRQRAVIGPWRISAMNRYLKYGLAAAAVVVLAVVAFNLLPGSPAPGGAPSASAEPSEAAPSAAPSRPADGSLPVGAPFVWSDGSGGAVPITVTIPASGWYGDPGFFAIQKNEGSGPPDALAVLVFNTGTAWSVPGDACHSESTMPATPSATVDELVAALSAQASRDASAPVDITVDGHAGKSITLHVPGDIAFSADEFTDCDDLMFCQFFDPEHSGPPVEACARTAQGPGQIDELWIVEVNDALVIIDAAYWEGTPGELVEEERAIVDSISFE